MNPEYAVLARKYAVAFFNVTDSAFDEHDFRQAELIKQFLRQHRQILFFLNLSLIHFDVKEKVINYICEGFHTSDVLKKLIALLIKQRRAYLMPDVLHHIGDLYMKITNTMVFTISSSPQLNAHDIKEIILFLEHETHKHIVYEYKQDPKLIAGLRLKSDTLLWEYSIQDRLDKIKHAFI